MNYEFHPAAEAEFLELVEFYEFRVSGLGKLFITEFEALASLISDLPNAWQVEVEPDIRKAPLHRFPLSLIYRTTPSGFQILALAHDRQRPKYWQSRL
jgi:toxin ParE1/3/4